MANALMVASGYRPPSREVALSREKWLDQGSNVGNFLTRMATSGLKDVLSAYRDGRSQERRQAHIERTAGIAAGLTDFLYQRFREFS